MSKKQAPPKTAADSIAASWKDPAIRAARIQRVGVRVGKAEFRSVAAAVAEFAPHLASRVIAIRLALKAAGEVVVESLDGKPVRFVAVR